MVCEICYAMPCDEPCHDMLCYTMPFRTRVCYAML